MKRLSLVVLPVVCLEIAHADPENINAAILTSTLTTSLATSSSTGNVVIRPGGRITAKGTYGTSPELDEADDGAGTRFVWHPSKAAIRAGEVTGTEWDEDSIGNHSAAFGYNTKASGDWSFAAGYLSNATGLASTALGATCNADGLGSVALGASGVSGNADYAVAMGTSFASAERSVALASSFASGVASTSMGYSEADSFLVTTVGAYNIGGGDGDTWVGTDPLFEIGNGTNTTPSNAVTVYKNGNVDLNGDVAVEGVITCAPGGDIPMFSGD